MLELIPLPLTWTLELNIRTLLSASLLNLGGQANTDQAVVRLELLHGLGGVVDQGEAGGLSATKLGAQAKDRDLVLTSLVHASQLVAELVLGDVGAVGVQDVTVGVGKFISISISSFLLLCCMCICPKVSKSGGLGV